MSNDRNAQTIEQGLKKAREAIMRELANQLDSIGGDIAYDVLEVEKPKFYKGFTGNAQTSYTSQVWIDGKLTEVYSTGSFQSPPIRRKVYENEAVHLREPYEGRPREITGKVDIEQDYSNDTIEAISAINPKMEKGVALRMAVGVEYNNYIGDPIGEMYKRIKSINFTKLRIDVRN